MQSSRLSGMSIETGEAIKKCIHEHPRQGNKPWISEDTLSLVALRLQARAENDWRVEQQLRTEVKRPARKYRATWLENLAGIGTWAAMKLLSKGRRMQQRRLVNDAGGVAGSEARAQSFAAHFQTLQWSVRPSTLIPGESLAICRELEGSEQLFAHIEVRKAIHKISSGKSVGEGDPPIECFKAISNDPGPAFQ